MLRKNFPERKKQRQEEAKTRQEAANIKKNPELVEALTDLNKGCVSESFDTAEELSDHLRGRGR